MNFNNYSNAGYLITKSELYATEGITDYYIVFGERRTRFGMEFVTWQCKVLPAEEPSFYWGHYCSHRLDALADYHERLMNEYARREAK